MKFLVTFLFGVVLVASVCLKQTTVAAKADGVVSENNIKVSPFDIMLWRILNTKFYLHTVKNPDGVEFEITKKNPDIKGKMYTVILVHGFQGNITDLSDIAHDLLHTYNHNINVISYCWRVLAGGLEFLAAFLSITLGKYDLGIAMSELKDKYQIDPLKIHLIGYDMGAHLVGAAARVQETVFGRVTGLDPHNKYFHDTSSYKFPSLTAHDAQFVDVLHTNGGDKGIFAAIGTADFYPNGGKIQPACSGNNTDVCSSRMSLKYYAESITGKSSFWGRACGNMEDFTNKLCSDHPIAVFGEYGNTTVHGSFFYTTNSVAPYGKGPGGANF